VWRVHVEPKWGHRRIADIRPAEVQKWVAELKLSASSVAHAHTVLAGILDDAMADRRLATNPARGVKLPRKSPKVRNYLTAVQASALADESNILTSFFARDDRTAVGRDGRAAGA
jgi:site-specific recombinase XerC